MSRSSFLRAEYGELYHVFQRIKEIFDPRHVLNPGKIVGADESDPEGAHSTAGDERRRVRPSAAAVDGRHAAQGNGGLQRLRDVQNAIVR